MAKTRWKFSFVSRSSPPPPPPSPPVSFICPVSSSLMFDPVILPTGQTFERSCIQACVELNFFPPSLSSSSIDFSSSSSSPFLLIPNAALKSAIVDWCDHFGLPHPSPLSKDSARQILQRLMADSSTTNSIISMSPSSKSEPPPVETNNHHHHNQKQQQHHSRLSSMPSSSVSSCSYPSSSSISSFSSSSEIVNITSSSSLENGNADDNDDCKTPKSTTTAGSNDDALEEEIFLKLRDPQISIRESGLVTLRLSARDSSALRLSLCTTRILAAVVPMIVLYKHPCIQINATASIVNLSIEPSNKVKIVRAGAVPPLVDVLKSSSSNHTEEARDNAAGALFSLALEDENKLPIGVLGAIPQLVDLFCQQQYDGRVARVEAGMALYHLSLAPNNLSKIAKTAGAVMALLNVVTSTANAEEEHEETNKLRRVALMVLANLARRNEGRVVLMDSGAVKAMVEGLAMSKEGAAGREDEEEEYCLAVMYEMSKGTSSIMRFRALARAAGSEMALLAVKDKKWIGEVGKEMATRILRVIRGEYEERGAAVMLALGDEAEEEEVGSVVSEGLVSFRRKYNDDFGGGSGSNSANF